MGEKEENIEGCKGVLGRGKIREGNIYMYDRGRKILKNTSDRGTSRGLETSRGKILRLAKHGKIASR